MVVATVVVGAVVVGARVVVVGRGRAVVGGAVVAGRLLGGVVASEVRGAEGGGAGVATVEHGRGDLGRIGRRTVVRGVPRLPAPAAATAATVVVGGHGRPPQAPGGAGSPKA